MTNGQDEINEYLNKHFHEEFLRPEYLSQFNNQEEAEEVFHEDFEYRYNDDEGFNCDLAYIKGHCDFLTTMNICNFVADAYDEYDMKLEKDKFKDGGDGLLKAYIYFYLQEKWYGFMMEHIAEYVYEVEPELPPAQ